MQLHLCVRSMFHCQKVELSSILKLLSDTIQFNLALEEGGFWYLDNNKQKNTCEYISFYLIRIGWQVILHHQDAMEINKYYLF